MRKIISKKWAAQFNELYDWVDDDTVETLDDYNANDFEVVDYDALEQGEVPVMTVDDEGIEEILTDNLDEPQMEEPIIEEPEEEPLEEIAIEGEDVPDFASVQEAMQWAIDNNRVVKIFYTTKGERRGRGGKRYLVRERGLQMGPARGVNIYRIVEPHHMYQAGNGNLILVTYDRSVRHIRAFIVDNITDYNFTKNRRTKEPQYFKPRVRIIPKSEKGIKIMKNVNEKLTKIAAEVEEKGMTKSASIIKEVTEIMEDVKTAQYVGLQGYWVRNRRCWDNCYRHKRTAQPGTPAQEVWMECWDEYKDSINNDKSGWEKYAFVKKAEWDVNDPKERKRRCLQCGEIYDINLEGGQKGCSRCDGKNQNLHRVFTSVENEKSWNKYFISQVEGKIKEGMSTPESVYTTIEEESQKSLDKVLDGSSKLMALAETMSENNMEELGERLADASTEMLREAGLFSWLGGKIGDWAAGKGKVMEQLKQISDSASFLAQQIRNQMRYTKASNKKIIIEAKKNEKNDK